MPTGPLTLVAAKTAAEVCRRFTLDADAQKLLDDRAPPHGFLDQLIEKGLFPDAVRVLAYGLPKREAVWWACQCVRAGGPLPPKGDDAVRAAETWVADPSDANRAAALAVAEAADFTTPAGAAALAAYWSGGWKLPPDAKVEPPPDDWTPHVAAGAVMVAAIAGGPEKTPATFKALLELGVRVATGAARWK